MFLSFDYIPFIALVKILHISSFVGRNWNMINTYYVLIKVASQT